MFFKVNEIDLHEGALANNTNCDVQNFQKLAPRILPPLTLCKENLQPLKENFLNTLIILILNITKSSKFSLKLNFFMQHIIKLSESFLLLFGLDRKILLKCKHRNTKVPNQYSEKLSGFLNDLHKMNF